MRQNVQLHLYQSSTTISIFSKKMFDDDGKLLIFHKKNKELFRPFWVDEAMKWIVHFYGSWTTGSTTVEVNVQWTFLEPKLTKKSHILTFTRAALPARSVFHLLNVTFYQKHTRFCTLDAKKSFKVSEVGQIMLWMNPILWAHQRKIFCSTKCWFNTLLFHLHALGTCCATCHYKRRSLTILFTCTRENVAFLC